MREILRSVENRRKIFGAVLVALHVRNVPDADIACGLRGALFITKENYLRGRMNPFPTLDRIALYDADVPAERFRCGKKGNHRFYRLRCDSLVLAFGDNHFIQDGIQAARHAPVRIMALQFRQIRDVTDVVPFARLL